MHDCRLLALILGMCLSLPSPAIGDLAPPSDAEVQAAIDDVASRVKGLQPPALFEQRAKAVHEVMQRLGVGELSLAQLTHLREKGMLTDPDMRPAVFARLAELAKAPSADGAAAAALQMDYVSPDFDLVRTAPERAAARAGIGRAAVAAILHPAIREAWQAGRALDVLSNITRADPAALSGPELIDALDKALQPGLGWPVIVRLASLVEALADVDAGHTPSQLQRVAARALSLLGELKPQNADDEKSVQILRRFFEGAMARGELIGRPAPWTRLNWTSPGLARDLGELKGRVVVVLFWHTQAKGSVRALAAIENIRKKYEHSPVSVVAITSLQGKAVDYSDPKKGQRVDTSKDPEREYALTRQLMDLRHCSAHLAFVDSAYDPAFGVVHVPLAAVIDPKGSVAMRAGDPRETYDEICATIDKLLDQFDLPRPAAGATSAPGGSAPPDKDGD